MAQILITNTNDGERSRTSTYTAGDIVSVEHDDFVFGARESIDEWIRQGNKAKDFPNGFIIISVKIPLHKAKALQTTNNFPMRLSNYNLDLSKLPSKHKKNRKIDKNKKMTSGDTKLTLTLLELDQCLLPRMGRKKPSDF